MHDDEDPVSPLRDSRRSFDPETAGPELRLMLAVLEDAVVTLRRGRDSICPLQRQEFFEVGSWVSSRDLESPFSFENVCSELGLDPGWVRDGLDALRRNSAMAALRKAQPLRRGWRDMGPPRRAAANTKKGPGKE